MRRFATFIATMVVAAAANAAPPTEQSIDDLMTASKVQTLLTSMYANVETMMRRAMVTALNGEPATESQQRAIDSQPAKFGLVLREELSWEKLRPIYVEIYQETFTQDEVDGLLAFYRTPAGAAMIDKMPVVMQKSVEKTQRLLAPFMAKMQAEMQESLNQPK